MPFRDISGHERPIAILQAALSHERLGHAYLFHGEDAIGKRLTAIHLAQALNCERPSAPESLDGCGSCRACQQIAAHTHPDFIAISPGGRAAVVFAGDEKFAIVDLGLVTAIESNSSEPQ